MRQSLLMLSLILTLMIGAAVPSASGGPSDARIVPVKPDVAAARVAACGFKSARARFDDELQEEVVEVRNISSASAEQLQCAAAASLDSGYYVIFPAPVARAYATLYWPMSWEREKADARAWLDKRGLLSRLPTYDPKRSDEAAFARALEALCGPKAAGTLQPVHGAATFRDGALGTLEKGGFTEGKLDDETIVCLLNVTTASDYPLVVIGNAASEERP